MCSQLDKGTSGVTGGPCCGHSLRSPAERAGGICEGGGDLAGVLRHGIDAADAQLHRVTTPQQRLTSDDNSRSRPGKSSFGNPGDDLAAQARPVERALAGDDEVGALHQRVEADCVKDRVHPTDPMCAKEHQSVAQASGGARARLAFESFLLAGEQVPADGNGPADDLGEVTQRALELLPDDRQTLMSSLVRLSTSVSTRWAPENRIARPL